MLSQFWVGTLVNSAWHEYSALLHGRGCCTRPAVVEGARRAAGRCGASGRFVARVLAAQGRAAGERIPTWCEDSQGRVGALARAKVRVREHLPRGDGRERSY